MTIIFKDLLGYKTQEILVILMLPFNVFSKLIA